jgi:hypothetical protein
MTCPHDLAERETAVADGMCPLCLAAENERAKQEIEEMRAALQEIADLRYDNTSAATIARRALEGGE